MRPVGFQGALPTLLSAISGFPCIHAAAAAFPAESVALSQLADRLRLLTLACGEYDFPTVEAALAALGQAGFSTSALQQQLAALFSSEEAAYNKGVTELLALGHFAALGLLQEVEWPRGYGASAPFDGTLRLASPFLAFDVKPAIGNNLDLMAEMCTVVAAAWEARTGTRIEIVYTADNAHGRAQVGKAVRERLRPDLETHLAAASALPVPALRCLIGDLRVVFHFQIPQQTLIQTIWTDTVSAGADAWTYIRGHIEGKGKHASVMNVPFVLVYVQPSTCGSADLARLGLLEAALANARPPMSASLPMSFVGLWLLRFHHVPSVACWRFAPDTGFVRVSEADLLDALGRAP